MQLYIPVRVAPAQVRCQRFACQIVWKYALRAGLNEREFSQPLEQTMDPLRGGARSRHPEHLAQESLSCDPDQCTGFQGSPMRRTGDLLHESFHQGLDHVWRFFRMQAYMTALREDFSYQRQRERMPMRKFQNPLLVIDRQAALIEEGSTFLLT